ncbi:hypothetical protein A9P82_14205 [Arachidicoccus ginsenosidimutans]|uniref:hypothetical protein n=1 Tax=Arachidicoccus sp. BS20 TaxID=1850526 RepID=UPI0007F06F2E|nr:hypothetical protein [Arachidicoccus sp. BS20]ANI90344.1 hypothetical protein A9P82_14205 [Arachidicoccus sp. BS20]
MKRKFYCFILLLFISAALPVKLFSQTSNEWGGVQLGFGVFAYDAFQYNRVAQQNNLHTRGGNAVPEIKLGISLHPVTAKYNVDATFNFWEINHRVKENIPASIPRYNKVRLQQFFGSGDLNFDYRVLATERTLVIPAIGIGYMQDNIRYQDVPRGEDFSDDDGDENPDMYNTKVARNDIVYLNFKVNYLLHIKNETWLGLQLGYKYGFGEKNIIYDGKYPFTVNHSLNGFYATLIVALR